MQCGKNKTISIQAEIETIGVIVGVGVSILLHHQRKLVL